MKLRLKICGKAILDASNADSKKRRPFDGLVIDWNLIHIFAIVASITMVFVNIYATWVVNNFRKVPKDISDSKIYLKTFQELYKGSGQGEDVETIARLRAEMLEQERQVRLRRGQFTSSLYLDNLLIFKSGVLKLQIYI